MRLPYYLYTYRQAAEQTETDQPTRPVTFRMPGLLLVGAAIWVAVVAFAVFGQW